MSGRPPAELPHAALDELRVLVATALSRDAGLTRELLDKNGIESVDCTDDDAFFAELDRGAGAVVLAQERLTTGFLARLQPYLDGQPAWSDLPLIVVVAEASGGVAVRAALNPLGNLTTIERPTRQAALVGAVRVALRARQRQYDSRTLLARLTEADRRKDAFIAVLGHELRNPLAAIAGAARLLDAIPDKSERLRRSAEVLNRQTAHLRRLVDDVLDVARVTAGKLDLKREVIDARVAARDASSLLEHVARDRGHRLDLELASEPSPIDVDPVRFEQMLGNVIHNAIKYTADGGVIRVRVETLEGHAVIRVADNGRGLTPESLDRIFDPFSQVDASIHRSMGGLGLGLSLVRQLATMHGGSVEARSEGIGRGSEFILRFPLAPDPAAASERGETFAPTAPGASGPPLRILLVDDFLDALELLRLELESRGCIVETATNGVEAVERSRTARYDIAFVDIGLPEMDGLAVARAIRASETTRDLPLVAMSGYGQDEDRRRSALAGFDRHLVKPVASEAIFAVAFELISARDPSRLPGA